MAPRRKITLSHRHELVRLTRWIEMEYLVELKWFYYPVQDIAGFPAALGTLWAVPLEGSSVPGKAYATSGTIISKRDSAAEERQHLDMMSRLMIDLQIAMTYGERESLYITSATPPA